MTLAFFMLSAGVASAATVTSQAVFTGGQTQTYGNAGQSVQTNFQVHVNAGEVLHAIRTKVDSQPTICTAVGPFEGDQTVTLNTSIMYPPNSSAGGYSLVADLFTTDTAPQAQAMTGDLACSSAGAGAHVFTGAYNGATVVNVLPMSGSSSGGTASMTMQQQIADAVIAAFKAMGFGGAGTTTPTPTPAGPSANCAALYAKQPGTSFGVYNDANVSLQGFLLSWNPNSIPALKAGSTVPMGFYGNQTAKAVSDFKTANSCI